MAEDTFSAIEQMLVAHGVHLKQARGPEKRADCIFHDDHSGHLYINTQENLYFCQVCNEKGNGKTLAKHYGVKWLDDEDERYGDSYFDRLRLQDCALAYYQDALHENLSVFKYLKNDRGLTVETIEKAKLGYAPNIGLVSHLKDHGFTIKQMKESGLVREDGAEFFRDRIIIPYLANGHCVQLRGKQIGGKYLTPPDNDARLYGLDTIKDADEVVLCEGEFDALTVRQAGFAAVAVPGAGNFKEEWGVWFEGYRRIYICFDADEAGEAGAEKAKKMLGRRVRVVKLPKPDTRASLDLNEYFMEGGTPETFGELLRSSQGKRLQRTHDIRKRWLEMKNTGEGLYLGLHPRWDHILQPGFQRGQLITMLAKTGAGKTVSMLNMSYQNRNVPQIMVSLEQTSEELYERMRRISLFYNPRLSDDEIDNQWGKVAICDENRMNGKDFEDLLNEYEEEFGEFPLLVWVDYLGYFARGYKGEEYMRLSDAVMDLKAMAKKYKIIIFTPHQVNRSGKDGRPLEADMARGSGVIEETSDFCFALWKPHEAEQNDGAEPGQTCVRVLKSRHGGKGSQFTMYQAPQSLAIVPDTNLELRNMVMAEYREFEKGSLWPEIHEARKATGIKPLTAAKKAPEPEIPTYLGHCWNCYKSLQRKDVCNTCGEIQ